MVLQCVSEHFFTVKEGIVNMTGNPSSGQKIILSLTDDQPWDLRGEVWSRSAGSLASDGVYMKTELPIDGFNFYLKLSWRLI